MRGPAAPSCNDGRARAWPASACAEGARQHWSRSRAADPTRCWTGPSCLGRAGAWRETTPASAAWSPAGWCRQSAMSGTGIAGDKVRHLSIKMTGAVGRRLGRSLGRRGARPRQGLNRFFTGILPRLGRRRSVGPRAPRGASGQRLSPPFYLADAARIQSPTRWTTAVSMPRNP